MPRAEQERRRRLPAAPGPCPAAPGIHVEPHPNGLFPVLVGDCGVDQTSPAAPRPGRQPPERAIVDAIARPVAGRSSPADLEPARGMHVPVLRNPYVRHWTAPNAAY